MEALTEHQKSIKTIKIEIAKHKATIKSNQYPRYNATFQKRIDYLKELLKKFKGV